MPFNILVVDDNDMNLTLVSKILELEGYQVALACCGQEAIQAFIQKEPDMAILDVMMPDINGFELCRKLRQPPIATKVPLMLLTAMNSEYERKMALEAGANEIWSKPFDMDAFRRKVEQFLLEK